jgi:hypothetical protein
MAFVAAMSMLAVSAVSNEPTLREANMQPLVNTPLTKQGVKGSDVYTEEGVGDPRVVLFTELVRGQGYEYIDLCVKKILQTGSRDMYRDLVVMMFQCRDVRGGKGERDLFYNIFKAIHQEKPEWTPFLLTFAPEYGCWKDLWKIATLMPEVSEMVERFVYHQFQLDQEAEYPSLLVKWLPREGSKYEILSQRFANVLFPFTPIEDNQRRRAYRKAVAYLNKKADTAEIKMCANEWSTLVPKRIPGRLMKRNKYAFFNQKKGHNSSVEDRYPDREDRVKCKEHFEEFMEDVKSGKVEMKGATTTMPHEHVHEILHNHFLSQEVEDVIQAQWDAIRNEVLKGGSLNKVVPMCDFSGSMSGTPIEVSFALGILISEIADPAFKDHILTFDSEPRWHSFAGKNSLKEKVLSVGSVGQGLSTDFQKACDCILERMIEHKVAPADAPTDLLVLTDMGFDQACYMGTSSYNSYYSYNKKNQGWQTHFQMIRSNFEKHGYQAPRIVCWNLRAEYKDFHAKAYEEGVVQLSGWSPSMLKAIQGKGIQVQTPYEGMRVILDDTRYDKVRELMKALLPA